jgi:hypothetical protein
MENTNPVVNGEVTAPNSEVVKPQEQEPVVPEETPKPAPQAGSKTDPNLLLASLKEEREKRKLLEEELETLKSSNLSEEEVVSDEGRILAGKIKTLEASLDEIRSDSAKKDVLIANPILKEKWNEFEEFRSDPENKGMNLRTAAKAFLVENGLIDVPRKGLEKPTGGTKIPLPSGTMTAQEAENLMKNDFKKYQELIRKGQLKIQ